MNIAVFIKSTTFHAGFGGLETQNKVVCEGLASQGNTVYIFSPKKSVSESTQQLNGVDYVFIPSNTRTLYQAFASDSWVKKSVEVFAKYHSDVKFDLVVSQSSAGVAILQRKEEFGVKAVAIAHGSIISEIATRLNNVYSLKSALWLIPDIGFALYNFFFRQRQFVHSANLVICVSDYVKNALIEETYSVEKKFRVIHNGVDPERFSKIRRTGSDHAGTRFLYVGQVTREKGVKTLLEIFSGPKFADTRLDVIGDGEYLNQFKLDVKSLGLDDRIYCHGKLPYTEVSKFYQSADIFVMPTNRIEGFPMVLVEAMLAGLPIVAFDLGGVKDAIIEGETGYCISGRDVQAFRSKCLELVDNSELRLSMGEKAQAKALAEFTQSGMLEQYSLIFKELVK